MNGTARLLPQQAALFGPVGRFLGRGYQTATIDRSGRIGVLVLPNGCAILGPEPGEPRGKPVAAPKRFPHCGREQRQVSPLRYCPSPRGGLGLRVGRIDDGISQTSERVSARNSTGLPGFIPLQVLASAVTRLEWRFRSATPG